MLIVSELTALAILFLGGLLAGYGLNVAAYALGRPTPAETTVNFRRVSAYFANKVQRSLARWLGDEMNGGLWIVSNIKAFAVTFLVGMFAGFALGTHAVRADMGPWVFGAIAVAALAGSWRDDRRGV